MVRNDLFISVPSFFKCPISLDVMKSPVSLCTGVTYDRSSIQAWLDNGNNTCPATMQVLDSKDFVPNHTLHRLIQIWSNNSTTSSHRISKQQARDLVTNIKTNCDENSRFDSLSKISDFAAISDENCKLLAETDGFIEVLVGLVNNSKLMEQGVRVLDRILPGVYKKKEELMKSMARNSGLLSSLVLILHKGGLDSKMESARVLEFIAAAAIDPESKILIAETQGMLMELLRMIDLEEMDAINAGLSCLIALSVPRRIKVRIVRLGGVQTLGKILATYDDDHDHDSSTSTSTCIIVIEKTLKILEMVSTCTEGRTAICEDPKCLISDIVQKMLKVSKMATEHGAVILWSVCYLFRDRRAQDAVMKSNGLTKILVLMQSNCSPSVRRMCLDLIKIFRVNAKSCLSSYDTKTTHIMPF